MTSATLEAGPAALRVTVGAVDRAAAPVPVLPVGARFPRWTRRDVLERLTRSAAITEAPRVRYYPVGARFPRRSGGRLQVVPAATVHTHAPVWPVGARFPRRPTVHGTSPTG